MSSELHPCDYLNSDQDGATIARRAITRGGDRMNAVEAGKYVGMHEHTVRSRVREGRMPCHVERGTGYHSSGTRFVFYRGELAQWLLDNLNPDARADLAELLARGDAE